MVRRNLKSDFVGGAYVFPGGAVDPADGGPEAEALCAGRSDAEASALLGFDAGGLAYWVAVVRETFEEAGLLLAQRDGAPSSWVPTATTMSVSPPPACGSTTARCASSTSVATSACVSRSATIHYFAHWITPAARPAVTTPGSSWPPRRPVSGPPTTPARRSPRCGSAPPTPWPSTERATSRSSSPPSATSKPSGVSRPAPLLLDAAAAASSAVPAIEPRVVPDGNGMRIVLPGDPAYERARWPTPTDECAGRLQRSRARRLHAGERGGSRRRPRAPPGGP